MRKPKKRGTILSSPNLRLLKLRTNFLQALNFPTFLREAVDSPNARLLKFRLLLRQAVRIPATFKGAVRIPTTFKGSCKNSELFA